MGPLTGSPFAVLTRLLAASLLTITGIVHYQLAPAYGLSTSAITIGNLFLGQALACFAAAAWLAFRPGRWAWRAVLAVAAASLVAVVSSRYVELPPLGPIPSLYEPVWSREAVVSAVTEAGVLLAWALGRTGADRQEGSNRV